MNLMFTGGGGPGNEAIYRLWKDQYKLYFADADLLSINPSIPRAVCYEIPLASNPIFFDELLNLVKKMKIDVLIPGVDEELLFTKKLESVVSDMTVLSPDVSYIETMLDKFSMFQKLDKSSIDVPWTMIADVTNNIAFPCIAKPRRGRGSRGFQVLYSYDHLEAYRKLSPFQPSDIILQERLVGQEYTVLMAADGNKNLHAVVPVRVDIKKGITIRAETEKSSVISNLCERIHRSYPTSGCYNIQLILTGEGRVVPFEINPRISTTFCLGLAAGIDPIEIFFRNSYNAGLESFENEINLRRHWGNFISESKSD